MTEEMGAPLEFSKKMHAIIGQIHLKTALGILRDFPFEESRGKHLVYREPVGVCGLITPWNWPINQVAVKVAPALACGCTMVLKPSELSPFSAQIWTEILDAAGTSEGVFNLVQGNGPVAGAALSAHPGVDMVSFTGSTRAGVEIGRAASATIKRVHQELGGKSANIILPDADIRAAVEHGMRAVASNSGQSCNAPTRMLVPAERMQEAAKLAGAIADGLSVGDPQESPDLGPVVSATQYERVQSLIESGIAEGATLVAGGPGRPEGLDKGYFIRPTVFADVSNDMKVARQEIFGPVLSIIGYDSVDDAITIANDSDYGLAAYIQGTDKSLIDKIIPQLRVGQVNVNGTEPDPTAPFGGYKQSGNGREWGDFAFEAFLEVKSVLKPPS